MAERICTIDGCESPHHGRGLCVKHYKADHYRRNSDRHKAHRDAWRAANQDRIRAIGAAAYRADPARKKAQAKAWAAANTERKRRVDKKWSVANAERKSTKDKAYQAANAARIKARRAVYYQANKDKAQQGAARRKARKLGNRCGRVSYRAILAEHGMTCHLCDGVIESRADLHFDHIVPLALGGAHATDNIAPSHSLCNLRKGGRRTA